MKTVKGPLNRAQFRATISEAASMQRKIEAAGSCGECTQCCTVLAIDKLMKPEGTPCKSLRKDAPGCARYESRPKACRYFLCLWRLQKMDENLRPDKSGIVLYPCHFGDVFGIMAMATRREDAHAATQWLNDLSLALNTPIMVRVCREKLGGVVGTPEQQKQIIEHQRKKGLLRVLP